MVKFLYWLTARLPCRIINGPNGEPYLERYFLFSLFSLFGWTAYIHRFVDNDPNRGLHDHPWAWSCSLVLAGGYHELRATDLSPHSTPAIRLRYRKPGQPAIMNVRRVSKPGARRYAHADALPRVLNGLGIAIVSTSQGLLTDGEARKRKLGGEVICEVY